MAALLKLVPAAQVVYGSDYPYVPMDVQVKALSEQGLERAVVEAIEFQNAQRLMAKAGG